MAVLTLDKSLVKPCARCGSKEHLMLDAEGVYLRIICDGDYCQSAYFETLDDAISEWNVRDGVYADSAEPVAQGGHV